MPRTKLSIVIDALFATFCASLVCYAWLLKYLRNMLVSLSITFAFAVVFATIIIKICFKKHSKLLQTNSETKYASECFEFLSLNKSKCKAFFAELLNTKKPNNNYFNSDNKIYYINYEDETLTSKDICKIKNAGYKNVFVCANSLTQSATNACNKFNFAIISKNEMFLLMKKQNLFPTKQTKSAKNIINSLKNIAKSIFDKKKAKHFLIYGVLLLAISFVVPFTFMYCIFGTISVVFGLICLMTKPRESIAK